MIQRSKLVQKNWAVGTDPSFKDNQFMYPTLNPQRLEKQSSVKWWEHSKRLWLYCWGIVVKMNFNHWFFTASSFGNENEATSLSQRRAQRLLNIVIHMNEN